MSTISDLTDAVLLIKADSVKYNAIINGPASGVSSTVTVGSGVVPTLAKKISELTAVDLSAILIILGIPSYTNLTVANTALAIGQPYFDTTLNKIQITTA